MGGGGEWINWKLKIKGWGWEGRSRAGIFYTDKKENRIFLIYREIQSGTVAKSYMRKGFLIYGEMRKYFPIMRRPLVIYDFATAPLWISLHMRKIRFSFYQGRDRGWNGGGVRGDDNLMPKAIQQLIFSAGLFTQLRLRERIHLQNRWFIIH